MRRIIGAALLASVASVASLASVRAAAQDTAAAGTTDRPALAEAAERPTAPIVVDGATLLRVRGVSAYPAERRAAAITERIVAVAADRAVPAESIAVRETPLGSAVVASGRTLLVVVDADAELEGLTRHVLAQAYQHRVAEAITAYRRDREPAALWRGAARAATATLALVLGLWAGRRASRRLRAAVERRYRSRVHDVRLRTIEIVRGDQVWRGVERAERLATSLLTLAACYAYVDYVLLLFPWTRALGHGLAATLLRPLTTLGTGLLHFLPDLLFLIVLALVTRWAIRLVGLLFRAIASGAVTLPDFDPEWARPTERIARIALVAAALIIAYPYIPGSGSEAFKGIGLVLGLMFSLGSPSVIGNVVAGLSLAFRRAFRVGDRVRIGEHVGEVAQVQLLTTYLRTPKNEQVVIPNALILNSEVVNFSTLAKDAGLILHTKVGIGYETPWRQVEAMLLEAARRTPGLRPEPAPFVLQRALGDFAVEYEVNVYCDDARGMFALYTALHRSILDVFNEYGVQIMTPAYEGDPEEPKVVPREQWFAAPARNGAGDGADRGVRTMS
jgi:small-conductance mechanosensitive channel